MSGQGSTEQGSTEQQGGTEQGTADPRTALDKFFDALRGIGVRRRTDDKWVGGVCSGLADRLSVDPMIVRVALVVPPTFLGVMLGVRVFGILYVVGMFYLMAWVLLPDDRDALVAERAVRDGDRGSVVLVCLTVFAFLVALGSGNATSRVFPFILVPFGLFVWWLSHPWARGQGWSWRAPVRPDAGQGVSAEQPATPYTATPHTAVPHTAVPYTAVPSPTTSVPSPTASRPVVPRKPRRRSGGARMALLAIGLALVTYGCLSWLGSEYAWKGDHRVVALAGSLAAIGLLLVVLGLAGWRAGFVAFLAVVLAISVWISAVVPAGLRFHGQVGDATWAPTSVTAGANYHLGVGSGVLNLRGLPTEGLREARLPAYVGLGELKVVVPAGLTVQVVGHVGLGKLLLPGEADGDGQGGTDLARSVVVGDGPTEVVVDAGVGIGQLTIVKE